MTAFGDPELRRAYAGKRVFVTGHTGFKGSWLTLWLRELGAEVSGYALAPDGDPTLFSALNLTASCKHVVADVRDYDRLRAELRKARPDVVFHLAAQAIVRESFVLDRPGDLMRHEHPPTPCGKRWHDVGFQ